MTLVILRHGDLAVGVEMPLTVDLKVTETGPSFKGNTAQSGTKPAKLETGVTVQVPSSSMWEIPFASTPAPGAI